MNCPHAGLTGAHRSRISCWLRRRQDARALGKWLRELEKAS